MNEKSVNEKSLNERRVDQRSIHDVPVPDSAAPELDHLVLRVGRRRRRRRVVGTALAVMPVIGLIVIGLGTSGFSRRPESSVEGPQVAINPLVPDAPPPSPGTFPAAASNDVRAFAEVHRPIPVFGRVPDTEYLHHVGWIESQEIVPVDVSQFSQEHQQAIRAVLDESEQPSYFNL